MGTDNTAFPQGFNQVTDQLKVGLDIRLETEVTRIDYPANQSLVTVTTRSGAQHVANHVVVTVPIGVLKAGTITFAPALPTQKQSAIQRVGSGLLNKVFLEFRPQDQFWTSGPNAPDVLLTSSPQRGAFSVWIDMQEITGKPILMAWTSGEAARTIEGWDDERTKVEAMLRLRDTFPGNVPDAINIKVTRWNQDPFARGSYSTFAQSTQLGDRALLREPVANRKVLFAGEATVDSAFSQVTGAYASGIREADRLSAAY
jgi:monoamine oxidase